MFILDDRQKDIIKKYPIDNGLDYFRKNYSDFVLRSSFESSCKEIASSVMTDKGDFLWIQTLRDMLIALVGAEHLIKKLLGAILGLDTALELPPHRRSSHKSLFEDIISFLTRFPEKASVEDIAILLEHVITEPVDVISLWAAVYRVVYEVSSPPIIPSQKKSCCGFTPVAFCHSLWQGLPNVYWSLLTVNLGWWMELSSWA